MKIKSNILFILLALLWMPVYGWAQGIVDPGDNPTEPSIEVAKIGNISYSSLKAAFDKVNTNGEIDLSVSYDLIEAITVQYSAILDLNRLTLTGIEKNTTDKAVFTTTSALTVKNGTLNGKFEISDLNKFAAGTDVTLTESTKIIQDGKAYYRVLINKDNGIVDYSTLKRNNQTIQTQEVDKNALCLWLEADQAAYPFTIKADDKTYKTAPVSIQSHGNTALTLTEKTDGDDSPATGETYTITYSVTPNDGGTLTVEANDENVTSGNAYVSGATVIIEATPKAGYTQPTLQIVRESEGTPVDITDNSAFVLNDNTTILATFKKAGTVIDPDNPDAGGDIQIINPKQTVVYNGKPQSYILKTNPGGVLEGATISYNTKNGTPVEGLPTDAGTYNVTIKRPADTQMAAVDLTIEEGFIIKKADIFFEFEGEGYKLSGEDTKTATLTIPENSAYMLVNGGKEEVEGTFAWAKDENYNISDGALTVNQSGVYKVVFTPEKGEGNYNEAYTYLAIELQEGELNNKKRTVTAIVQNDENNKDLNQVCLYNGSLLVGTATPEMEVEKDFYEGQKPIFRAFPVEGSHFEKYTKKNEGDITPEKDADPTVYEPETFDANLSITGHFKAKTDLETLNPKITIPNNLVYNGSSHAKEIIITTDPTLENWIFTYKQNGESVLPINAGEYTLVVTRPADDTHLAYTSEKKTLSIKKATPKVDNVNVTPAAYPGLKLSDLQLTGKASIDKLGTILGTFEWAELTTEVTDGENTVKYNFSPADKDNINNLKDQEISFNASADNKPKLVKLTYNTPVGGALVVVYEEGEDAYQVIPSGSMVPTDTKVRIFAYAADYFDLSSLTINGEEKRSDIINNKNAFVHPLKVNTTIHANFRYTGQEPPKPECPDCPCPDCPDYPDYPDFPDFPDNWPDNWPDEWPDYPGQKKDYTILVRETGLGSVTPGTSGANRGENITFKIEPGYGQQIVDVRVNGNSVGAVESYQIKNIRSNTTLEAVFSNVGVPVHTLTSKVIHDWVGYVTPSKVRVTEGSNHIFIAHPNKNRKIDDVQIGTEKKLESIGTPSSYIFTDVKADSLIVVTFHSPVANESISAPDYMIYTEDKTVVVNPENEVGAIKIYDLMGRIVCSQAIETTTRIPLTEGIYVVVLTINDKQYVKKVSL